jgi:hypothetical protein
MATRYRLRYLLMTLLLSIPLLVSIAHPRVATAAFSCSGRSHDGVGGDGASTSTNAGLDGVSGQIYVPSWTSANLHGQPTTIADIAAIVGDGHFFQIGWYLGDVGGLPTAGSPQPFVGEGLAGSWETLTLINATLRLGDRNSFYLIRDGNPSSPTYNHYSARIGSFTVWTSSLANGLDIRPRMLGESNYDCADMYANASTSPGGPTLGLHHRGAASFVLWAEHYNIRFGEPAVTTSCWFDGRVNGYSATVLALDQC